MLYGGVSLRRLLLRLLRTWGSKVEVVTGKEREEISCVLQPTTSRSWQNMRRQVKDLGELPQGQFEYIGQKDISAADYLMRAGQLYLPRRCEPVYMANDLLCYWGLMIPYGEGPEWNR